MKRRDFLQLAAGTSALAVIPVDCFAAGKAHSVKIKPAICTGFDYSIPFADMLPMIRQAGFEVISLGAKPEHSGYDTSEGRAAMRKLIEKHGLSLDSIHAPFPEGDQLFSLDESKRRESVRKCKMAIEAARDLDGKIVVVHLIQPYDIPHDAVRDQMIAHGRESIKTLAAYAAENHIKLALENGQRKDYDEVLEQLLAEFNDEHVGFCYDSGHENVQKTCFRLLEKFGRRLLTVHIHDNRGADTHELPYEGNIDWDKFQKVFHRLDYRGNLLLESVTASSQFKDPKIFLAEAKKRAERLLQP
jgi:sugar phosphate isomerase/epimerase